MKKKMVLASGELFSVIARVLDVRDGEETKQKALDKLADAETKSKAVSIKKMATKSKLNEAFSQLNNARDMLTELADSCYTALDAFDFGKCTEGMRLRNAREGANYLQKVYYLLEKKNEDPGRIKKQDDLAKIMRRAYRQIDALEQKKDMDEANKERLRKKYRDEYLALYDRVIVPNSTHSSIPENIINDNVVLDRAMASGDYHTVAVIIEGAIERIRLFDPMRHAGRSSTQDSIKGPGETGAEETDTGQQPRSFLHDALEMAEREQHARLMHEYFMSLVKNASASTKALFDRLNIPINDITAESFLSENNIPDKISKDTSAQELARIGKSIDIISRGLLDEFYSNQDLEYNMRQLPMDERRNACQFIVAGVLGFLRYTIIDQNDAKPKIDELVAKLKAVAEEENTAPPPEHMIKREKMELETERKMVEAPSSLDDGQQQNDINQTTKVEISLLMRAEKETQIIKRYHPEAYAQLENAAKNNGFEKLLIDYIEKVVHVRPKVAKDAVFYPYNYFVNHEKLMKEYDAAFSEKGATILLRHEKSHFDKEPRMIHKEFDDFVSSLKEKKEDRESFKEAAREQGRSFEEAIKMMKRANYLHEELQTDVNAYTRKFESKAAFIVEYATERVYREFIGYGEEALTTDYKYGFESRFIKGDVLLEIDKKVKEIKQWLLDKHNTSIGKVSTLSEEEQILQQTEPPAPSPEHMAEREIKNKVLSLIYESDTLYEQEDYAESENKLNEAEEIIKKSGLDTTEKSFAYNVAKNKVLALMYSSDMLYGLGKYQKAEEKINEAQSLAKQHHIDTSDENFNKAAIKNKVFALIYASDILYEQGAYRKAGEKLNEAEELINKYNIRDMVIPVGRSA